MNNSEALAYIDRLWNKYGALYAAENDPEEAELMQKCFRALSIAKDAIKALEQESNYSEIPNNSTDDLGVNSCMDALTKTV
jgi:hypothetical protein